MRHYFNTRHHSKSFAWALPAGALGMICLAFVTGPALSTAPAATQAKVQYQPLPATAIGGKTAKEAAEEAAKQPAPVAQATAPAGDVGFDKVHEVIQVRCSVCHSATPTNSMFSAAPAGVMFDTPQQIQQMAPRIQAQAVATQAMPLGNLTKMTPQERELIGAWIAKGAQVN